MPFLILTRAGFDDLVSGPGLFGASIYLNPDLLSEEEIAHLRDAGGRIRILPMPVDPHAEPDVRSAILLAEKESGGPIWVEHAASAIPPSAVPGPAPQHAPPQPNTPPGLLARALDHATTKTAGRLFGQVLRGVKKHFAPDRPMTIVPYLGFGNPEMLSVRGRVLEDEGFRLQRREDSRWSNLLELVKRLESDEVAGARVRARFQGLEQEAVTDSGGYFSFEIVPATPLEPGWHAVALTLGDQPFAGSAAEPSSQANAQLSSQTVFQSVSQSVSQSAFQSASQSASQSAAPLLPGAIPGRAVAEVLVPPSTARFGVISDIDDTVLWTNVTNKLNMMRMLAQSNAHTRKPFKGVAAFYRALNEGAGGNENNPVFYVSSSPWHLFAPLVEFLRVQDIPVGPLMLKELGVSKVLGSGAHRTHKLDKIEKILRFYPALPFILIGDSGEQDPEIYAEVVKRHPKSVRVIYIRNVNPDPSRIEALDRLIEEVRSTGTQLILAPDSVFAATHAAGEGLISMTSLAKVRSDKKQDEGARSTSANASVPLESRDAT